MTEIVDRLPAVAATPMRLTLKFMRLFVAAGGLLMALTFFVVVIVRYGFSGNLFAYEEWLLAISFWTFFLGAALAAERKSHVNADILGVVLGRSRLAWWRGLAVYLIEFVIGIYIVYWCYLAVESEIIAYPLWEKTTALKIPAVFPRTAILVGFFFMTLFNTIYMILHIIDGPARFETGQLEAGK
ncbi:TRAP transporter small permease [Roseibium album]|uniref:TRAP transporter small permease n=1 Tax=Roseibium album TaxID=311410 RepID=UPI0024902ECA|nr:TRAP transporter small permease subunit [Roseibium album]MCR9061049.1 TRAP transporter small permease subunit [Paracoccaceae bacterium]